MTRLAALGTGIMGGAMARRWAGHGFDVTAWNRDRAKAEQLTDAGVTVADGPAAVVEGAEVVVTMLADGDVTEKVMAEALGAVASGAIWLQMATVGIDATDRLQAMAADVGVAFVDAPVSGTKQPAEQGKLTVLAGGSEEVRARCEPVFAAVAAKVVWVGGVGAGSRLKLVFNAWMAAILAGLAEAIALAERISIDPRQFLAAIEGGPLASGYAAVKGPMMIDRRYPAAFPLHLLTKDIDLVADAATHAGLDLRLPCAIRSLLDQVEETHGEDDMSAIIEALRTS